MKKHLILSLAISLWGASLKAADGYYATASGGRIFGAYDAALAGTPYLEHGKSRNAFSPSAAVGYHLSEHVSLEAAFTGDGSYTYDYEYAHSPFAHPGDVVTQVTQRLLIKENLVDVGFRVPLHFQVGQRFSVDLIPGVNRQVRRVEYSFRSVSAGLATPNQVSSTSITDTLLSTDTLGRFGVEGGVRCSLQATRLVSVFGAYRYTQSMRVYLSTVSLGVGLTF